MSQTNPSKIQKKSTKTITASTVTSNVPSTPATATVTVTTPVVTSIPSISTNTMITPDPHEHPELTGDDDTRQSEEIPLADLSAGQQPPYFDSRGIFTSTPLAREQTMTHTDNTNPSDTMHSSDTSSLAKMLMAIQQEMQANKGEQQKAREEQQKARLEQQKANSELKELFTSEIGGVKIEIKRIDQELHSLQEGFATRHESLREELHTQVNELKALRIQDNDDHNRHISKISSDLTAHNQKCNREIHDINAGQGAIRRELTTLNSNQQNTTSRISELQTCTDNLSTNIQDHTRRINSLEEARYSSNTVTTSQGELCLVTDTMPREKMISALGKFSGNADEINPKELVKGLKIVHQTSPLSWDRFRILISSVFVSTAREWFNLQDFNDFDDFCVKFVKYYWNDAKQRRLLAEIINPSNNFVRSNQSLCAFALNMRHKNSFFWINRYLKWVCSLALFQNFQ